MSASLKDKVSQLRKEQQTENVRGFSRELLQKHKNETAKNDEGENLPKFLIFNKATGKLSCQLCRTPIKSRAKWPIHANSSHHKNGVLLLQKKLDEEKDQATFAKPVSKVSTTTNRPSNQKDDSSSDEEPATGIIDTSLPENQKSIEERAVGKFVEPKRKEVGKVNPLAKKLPMGFFDDPAREAKIHGTEDPQETKKVELEQEFQKFEQSINEDIKEEQDERERQNQIRYEQQMTEAAAELSSLETSVSDLKQRLAEKKRKLQQQKKSNNRHGATKKQKTDQGAITTKITLTNDSDDDDDFTNWRCKKL